MSVTRQVGARITIVFATLGIGPTVLAELEDPTEPVRVDPVPASPARVSDLRLQGVFTQGQAHRALINDQMMSIGQSNTRFRLKQIFSDGVLIEQANGELTELWLTAKIKDK